MQASGQLSLREYLRRLEWWNQGLSPDVTQAQRVRLVLDGLRGGARTLFGRLSAGQLLAGTDHNGRSLPPLE